MADDNAISAAYITIADAATYLSISEVSIRRAIKEGNLPYLRLGRAVRIALADLDAFVAAHRITGEGGDA